MLKGKIFIRVYDDKPVETEFSGKLTGAEIKLVQRALLRGYRAWKMKRLKEVQGVSTGKHNAGDAVSPAAVLLNNATAGKR
ncbi:MAG: hypothetical protein DRH51_07205 [Candidatus Coatesbacteria bacterium]|nr:MAG: hypothetical protein DRH51_07205 [Candidatus Coatesbacteria bacterium]